MKRIVLALAALAAIGGSARADNAIGYQLDRYEPSTVGDWFFGAETPWYSSTRYLAAGLTFDYNRNAVVYGTFDSSGKFNRTGAIIANQGVGHLDIAGSLFDRVMLAASVPLTLFESGSIYNTPGGSIQPVTGVVLGDPRIGLNIRLLGQPEKEAASISIGGAVWIPSGNNALHAGDDGVRFLPRLMLGGVLEDSVRWTIDAGYLYRQPAQLTPAHVDPTGNIVGSEAQVNIGLGLINGAHTFNIGPEARLAFALTSGLPARQAVTNFELFFGAHYLIADTVLAGVAAGAGVVGTPGPPDFRIIVRLAYAPMRREEKVAAPVDSDGDGILDKDDACPDVKGVQTDDPKTNGCPPPKVVVPPSDRDHDGVLDKDDLCPDVPKGAHPDPKRLGCPIGDRDKDGVLDDVDLCPDTPMGDHPDPTKLGCPAHDSDGDGVYDYEDRCPNLAAGLNPDPDPARKGCPAPDRDGDRIPDAVDACPDQPGAPSPDPKKNGCPGLVQIKGSQIVILQQVFFATDKDKILPKSFPLLNAVAYTLNAYPSLKLVAVEGHTDNKGKAPHNMDLSQRRADSVKKYLVSQKVSADRLEAHGYGSTRPIADNKTNKGRAENRRVVFEILDPKPEAPATP